MIILFLICGFSFLGLIYGIVTGKNIITGNSYWTNRPIKEEKAKKKDSKDHREYLQYKKNFEKVNEIINN